jgi:hypothetical protein
MPLRSGGQGNKSSISKKIMHIKSRLVVLFLKKNLGSYYLALSTTTTTKKMQKSIIIIFRVHIMTNIG